MKLSMNNRNHRTTPLTHEQQWDFMASCDKTSAKDPRSRLTDILLENDNLQSRHGLGWPWNHGTAMGQPWDSHGTASQLTMSIWVWVKIRYPNNWMVNTKLDFHICGPLGLPF